MLIYIHNSNHEKVKDLFYNSDETVTVSTIYSDTITLGFLENVSLTFAIITYSPGLVHFAFCVDADKSALTLTIQPIIESDQSADLLQVNINSHRCHIRLCTSFGIVTHKSQGDPAIRCNLPAPCAGLPSEIGLIRRRSPKCFSVASALDGAPLLSSLLFFLS